MANFAGARRGAVSVPVISPLGRDDLAEVLEIEARSSTTPGRCRMLRDELAERLARYTKAVDRAGRSRATSA